MNREHRDEIVRTDPIMSDPANDRVELENARPNMWVPIALLAALILGIGYFLLPGDTAGPANVRADSGAVTQSKPSPN
jgi:hypothetical protein